MESGDNRIDTFDIMKFFGIIMVIVGHMTHCFENVIFSFHMPLFFIVAGYFYHVKDIRGSFAKDVKHLIYPYILTSIAVVLSYAIFSLVKENVNVMYWLVAMLYGNGSANHSSPLLADVPAIGAIWFLLALFWCKNIYNVICHYSKKPLPVSFLLSCVAIVLDRYVINLPFAILPGVGALMYYAFGNYVKKKGGFLKLNPLTCAVCILTWIASFLTSEMSMVRCYYHDFPVNVIGAIGGTYFLFFASNLLATCNFPLRKVVVGGGVKTA